MNDDDIAASLPEPPPPAPARRDAAIEVALRRFDAAGAGTPPDTRRHTPARPEPLPWWRQLGRPQIGAMVSVALVALVGIPAIWMSIENSPTAHAPDALTNTAEAPMSVEEPARPQDVAVSPSPANPVAPPATVPPPPATKAVAAPAIALADVPAMALAVPPPPPAAISVENESAGRVRADTQRAEIAAATAPSSALQRRAPAPPPPAAPRLAAAETDDRSIVVTGSRVQQTETDNSSIVVTGARVQRKADQRRGDWNACTVDDPTRNLKGCRRLVDPGAKGATGRAASHITDGLARAWEGDDDAAVAAFDQAIAVAPRNAFAYLNRGLAHRRQGDLDRAIADLDQAIRHDPRAARGYYVRSQLYRQRGDTRRARIDAERAVDIDPRYDDVVR